MSSYLTCLTCSLYHMELDEKYLIVALMPRTWNSGNPEPQSLRPLVVASYLFLFAFSYPHCPPKLRHTRGEYVVLGREWRVRRARRTADGIRSLFFQYPSKGIGISEAGTLRADSAVCYVSLDVYAIRGLSSWSPQVCLWR